MSRNTLTIRQVETLAAIESFSMEHGFPPTIRDLGKMLGVSSTNGVRNLLAPLGRKGRIIRADRVARGIVILEGLSEVEMDLLEEVA